MNDLESTEGRKRAQRIATELMRLGVSHRGVQELLVGYPYEAIERQLVFLPFRKAKRPEAMIIEAVRNNYSPPKELYYAKAQTQPHEDPDGLDESAQLPDPKPDADPLGLGAQDPPRASEADGGLERA